MVTNKRGVGRVRKGMGVRPLSVYLVDFTAFESCKQFIYPKKATKSKKDERNQTLKSNIYRNK